MSVSVVRYVLISVLFFFFNAPATTEIYTLSLHDALPILVHVDAERSVDGLDRVVDAAGGRVDDAIKRSEEHTSELQSQFHLVCRLLLEKKKKSHRQPTILQPPTSPLTYHTRLYIPHTSDI